MSWCHELQHTIDEIMEKEARGEPMTWQLAEKLFIADGACGIMNANKHWRKGAEVAHDHQEHHHKFTKEIAVGWVKGMVNADGSKGAVWKMADTTDVAKSLGVEFDQISEWCWWAIMHWARSDFYETAVYVKCANDATFYGMMAKNFIFDVDGKSPQERVSGLYFGVMA